MNRALLVLLVLIGVSAQSDELLQVPSPVMDYILGCERNLRAPKIPVARTAVDPITGIETEEVKLMDLGRLRNSLGNSFESGSMVEHIITEIEHSLTEQQSLSGRQACTQVTVAVPPQEVKNLDGQLQAVIQQSNVLLLQQINTLFSFKINKLFDDIKIIVENSHTTMKSVSAEPLEISAPSEQMLQKEAPNQAEVTANAQTDEKEKLDVRVKVPEKQLVAESVKIHDKPLIGKRDKISIIPSDRQRVKNPIISSIDEATAEKETLTVDIGSQSESKPILNEEVTLPMIQSRQNLRKKATKLSSIPKQSTAEDEEVTLPIQSRQNLRKKATKLSSIPKQSNAEDEEKPSINLTDLRKKRRNDMLELRRQFLNRRRSGN